MLNHSSVVRRALGLALALAAVATSARAVELTYAITEPFGLAWGPDRVTYPVEFPKGKVTPTGVALEGGAAQLSEIEFWPDGKTVRKAKLSFMVTLAPDQTGTWKVVAGTRAVKPPDTGVRAERKGDVIELTKIGRAHV